MKTVLIRLLVLFAVFALQASAADKTGTFSFLILKEGKPLSDAEIIVDNGAYNYVTDQDGYLSRELPVGQHTMQVIGRENGKAVVFARKPFEVLEGQDTQVILTLEAGQVAVEDVETPEPLEEVMDEEELKAAPKGTLTLNIVTADEQKSVEGARIFIKGTTVEAKTDADGTVIIELPEGTHTLSVIHGQYSSQTLTDIKVEAGKVASRSVEMTPASLELEEFVVLAPNIQGSIASAVAEQRESTSVADILGAEQFSKRGDGDAAAALKRVSGLTLVDGKNIYVRGLGERYANVQLNGLSLPSPDPVKRVVPLDIFPAGVIGSLKVQKSFSPDIPGAFGGGYIDIRTKKNVTEDYLKVSVSAKGHSSTFKEANFYSGGDDDWTGYDDDTRRMPQELLDTLRVEEGTKVNTLTLTFRDENGDRVNLTPEGREALTRMTVGLADRSVNTHKDDVPLGYSASLEFSKNFHIDDKQSIGVLMNYAYDQSHKYYERDVKNILFIDSIPVEERDKGASTDELTQSEYRHGGIFNLGYNYDELLSLNYTKLYLLNTTDSVSVAEGYYGSNVDHKRYTNLSWLERELDIDQINGTLNYNIGWDMSFDFGVEWADAELYQPGNVRYTYEDPQDTGDFELSRGGSGENTPEYEYKLSQDELFNYSLKHTMQLPLFSDEDTLEIGYNEENKERDYEVARAWIKASGVDAADLSLSVDDIWKKYLNDPTADYITLDAQIYSIFRAADYYDAELDIKSKYLKYAFKPLDSLEVVIGARHDKLDQTVTTYSNENPSIVHTVDYNLEVDDVLPSASIKYLISEDDQMIISYGESYIYPDFREFAPTSFFHPTDIANIIGNPDLTHTEIKHYDLRYAHYFSSTESAALSLFYKEMDNPIEDAVSNRTTSLPLYTFMNSKSATIEGFELDFYKFLDFIGEPFENYYVSGNYSKIDSEVELYEDQTLDFTSNHRQLQGLSPWVVNLNIGYDNREGRSVNLAYNKMAERIRKLGVLLFGMYQPDEYEVPPAYLDFTWIEKFKSGLSISFKAGNLLDEETVWTKGGYELKRFKTGRTFSLGMSYKY